MKSLFAFCGPIGSGKSSVSKLFSKTIGANWNSFGKTVREIAQERGSPASREDLQTLGAVLVANERNSFCRRVVAAALIDSDQPAVIDGLRHVEILEELRRIINPKQVICVYVDAPLAVRLDRVKKRDGLSPQQLADLEKHSTEVEVEQLLRGIADFAADNGPSTQECVDSIICWAQGRSL